MVCFSKLKNEFPNSVEYTWADKNGKISAKIIIDVNEKRIVIVASSSTARDPYKRGGEEFMPSVACNGVIPHKLFNSLNQ